MEYHEKMALLAYGIDRNLDTTTWTIKTIPAEHLAGFRAYVTSRYTCAIERMHKPDDPADQAWWHERCNEWYDILHTLKEQGNE